MTLATQESALREWRTSRRPEALGELLKGQRDRAYSVALRLTGSSADAEDAVQDAFIKLLSRTHGFDDVDGFEIAVYRAVVQCSLDAMRKKKRRETHEDAAGQHNGRSKGEFHVAGATGVQTVMAETGMSETAQQEARAQLRTAVSELPDDERTPVVLCYYQGMSVVQTAKTLELPRETVRARLQRGLGRLRRFLNANGKDVSAAAIVGLLWLDGAVQAPAGLCAALDAHLPGTPCAQTPAMPGHFGPAQFGAAAPAAASSAVLTAVALIALTLAGAIAYWEMAPRASNAPVLAAHSSAASETNSNNPAAIAESGAAHNRAQLNGNAAPRSQPGSVEVKKEDETVKVKLGTILLAGSMLLPAIAQAAEPNAQVGSIVAQIASRQAEKDAAAAAATQKNAQGEGRERSWGGVGGGGFAPGASPQTINPAPGATNARSSAQRNP